jgi:hypothetical protein
VRAHINTVRKLQGVINYWKRLHYLSVCLLVKTDSTSQSYFVVTPCSAYFYVLSTMTYMNIWTEER